MRARLKAAVGQRSIWEGDVRQLPFDGSRLLVPADLPAGFTATEEQGSASTETTPAVPTSSSATGAFATAVTVNWTAIYGEPAVVGGSSCRPGRGTLEIALGLDTGIVEANGWRKGSSVNVGGHAARWWVHHEQLALAWIGDGTSVAIVSAVGCQGDRLLDPAELERVARSLRPA